MSKKPLTLIEILFIKKEKRYQELIGEISNATFDTDVTQLEKEKEEIKQWLRNNALNVRAKIR
jgi:hypothetical protein